MTSTIYKIIIQLCWKKKNPRNKDNECMLYYQKHKFKKFIPCGSHTCNSSKQVHVQIVLCTYN